MNNTSVSWVTTRRGFLGLATAATAGAALMGCGSAKSPKEKASSGSGRKGEAGETLFFAGLHWGPPTAFSPLAGTTSWPTAQNSIQLIYETLVRFNMLDGSLQPGLGKEVKEADANTLEVPLQDGTKWADGTELTADDVVYTFEAAKSGGLSYSNVWTYLDSVTAKDARTVAFALKAKPRNPDAVKQAISTVSILPKHIWSKRDQAKLSAETNLEPIGSGPFKLYKYDQTQIILERRDDYWGKDVFGTPPMKYCNHPIFKGNQDGDLKLESGEIDVSQQFTAQIWKMWEKGKPVSTWLKQKPYYLPGNMPCLIFNTTKKGLDNPLVRKAMAWAIDYPNIASKAISDYSDPVNASLVVPKGAEEGYYDEAAVKAEGWTFDKAKAIDILENELKAKKGGDGIYVLPDGTRLGPWKLITPTGWTDWNTSCEIIAKSLQAIGVDVQTNFPQAPTMISAMQNGDFDLAHYSFTGMAPASPWARFRDVLDDRGIPAPGKPAFQNYGRFKHPDVPGLLDAVAEATDADAKKKAMLKLDAIFREQVPVVPVMYRALEFFEFNTSTWTNFPDEKNPYAPPTFGGAGIQWVFKLKKAGS